MARRRRNWKRYEERALTRFARALARGRFNSALEAARACRADLVRNGMSRSLEAVRRRMRERRDELNLAVRNTWWIPEEERILNRYARAVASHRIRPLEAAIHDCCRDLSVLHRRLAKTDPNHPLVDVERPASSVERRLRFRARAIDPNWNADKWSPNESALVDRFARAAAAGRYPGGLAAARVCRERLQARDGIRRSLNAVSLRINTRMRQLGARSKAPWTAAQDVVVERYVRALVRGRTPSVGAAAEVCAAEMKRAINCKKNRSRARSTDTYSHPWNAIVTRIRQRMQELGLAWSNSKYLPQEERIIDRFARRVVSGELGSVNAATASCLEALLDFHRRLVLRSPLGLKRVSGRHWEGVNTRLYQRCREFGRRRIRYYRWTRKELQQVARWVHWYELWHGRRPKTALGEAAEGLREALVARGHRRTYGACRLALLKGRRQKRFGPEVAPKRRRPAASHR